LGRFGNLGKVEPLWVARTEASLGAKLWAIRRQHKEGRIVWL